MQSPENQTQAITEEKKYQESKREGSLRKELLPRMREPPINNAGQEVQQENCHPFTQEILPRTTRAPDAILGQHCRDRACCSFLCRL